MRVAIICTDKPEHLQVRKANREAHVAYLKDSGVVEMAGPFLNGAEQMCGSLIVLDVPSLEAAHEWAAKDPYAKADLFEDVRIEIWNKVIG